MLNLRIAGRWIYRGCVVALLWLGPGENGGRLHFRGGRLGENGGRSFGQSRNWWMPRVSPLWRSIPGVDPKGESEIGVRGVVTPMSVYRK